METSVISPKNMGASVGSFIGLKAYSEADADMFFGRDKEIDRLYQLIKSNTLTSLFGKSGTGKTSLLNAGVFPKLRHDNCLPFRIRLEFDDAKPALKQQVWNVLYAQIKLYGFMVAPPADNTTLWEFFHREDLWKIVTPVLVFDQFEEIFTLVKKQSTRQKEIENLINELADLIENTIPEKLRLQYIEQKNLPDFNFKSQKAKIIFAFREDFLPEMESITSKIPSVKNSRFRLTAMRGYQAFEVITRTWKGKIADAEAEKLVDYLTAEGSNFKQDADENFDMLEIEPSLLSQVCTYLDKERIHEQESSITADFLSKYPKEVILSTIYHQALKDSIKGMSELPMVAGVAINPVQEFIEDKLITQEGYRTKFGNDEVPGHLKEGIDILKRKYFIREEGTSIELTHDVIAAVVKEDRDKRKKLLAQKIANEKARKKALKYFVIFAGLALAAWVVSAVVSTKNVNKAIDAKIERDSLALVIADEKVQLDSIRKEKVKDIVPPVIAGIPQDSLIKSLHDSLIDANATIFNYKQLLAIYKAKADSANYYSRLINDQNLQIARYKKMEEDFRQMARWKAEQAAYIKMYQTHVRRIVRDSLNADSLRYHIRVLGKNFEGFERVLN